MSRYVIDALKRRWDWLRRQVAIWVWDRPAQKQDGHSFSERVVFIRWDAKLGDTIVLSWVFRELQRQRPDLQITVITAESFKELFVQGYGITSVYTAGKRHGWRSLLRIARELARPEYVVHLSLKWRPRDIRFVRALSPRHVVGLDDDLNLVDIKLGELTRGRHFSEKLVPWLEQLGVDTSERQYWIPRDARAREQVDAWWPQERVFGLCPYGASKKRRLSDALIKEALHTLAVKAKATVIVIAQPVDLDRLGAIFAREPWFDHVLLKPAGNLFLLFEQVARCQAIVSVDTAIVHLATGFQLPTLALYAAQASDSENMVSWHPRSSRAHLLIATGKESEGMSEFEPNLFRAALQWLIDQRVT